MEKGSTPEEPPREELFSSDQIIPCIPEEWAFFKIHYRYKTTLYHIVVTQNRSSEKTNAVPDGLQQSGNVITLTDDGAAHQVDITLSGRSANQQINKYALTPSL